MPRATLSVEVDAPCEAVFALVHDYARRLEWDSMLSEARLLALGWRTLPGRASKSLYSETYKFEYSGFREVPGRAIADRWITKE